MKTRNTILVVDDEFHAQDIMEGFLSPEGYELAFAASGAETLDCLRTRPPDVILLDVLLPDMDGFEVCRQIKAEADWQHIPVIIVTVLGGKVDLIRGFEAGADDFLHKPVNELELRARVRSMVRIKKQYDELKANLELREDLARMIMHDMRAPLNIIAGYSKLSQEVDIDTDQKTEFAQKIEDQARRLNSFLTDMLVVAKMEAGQLILNRSLVDINDLVNQIKTSHGVIAQSNGVRLEINLPANSREVSVDPNLFHRVLDNLVSNALKFSPAGSTVWVNIENLPGTYEPQTDMSSIRVKVVDEGPGIPEDHRDRIFDKFEVAALQRRGVAQVGLGLAFCKMVIDAHGGWIRVDENQPEGSIFTVEI
jgi:signal transduction histidine kinase